MLSRVGALLLGNRLPTSQSWEERLSNVGALAILSSDALSSVAYATEELLLVLVLAGMSGVSWSLPVSLAIVGLLSLLVISYRQLIRAYPAGGGGYTVAKENLGSTFGLVAASGLLLDFVLTAAVSLAAGVAALVSAFPDIPLSRVQLSLMLLVILTVVNLRGVRETGRAFTIPTLIFIASILGLLGAGLFKVIFGGGQILEPTSQPPELQAATLFLLMRGFSSGCAAVTGVEAISNGTGMFKRPEAKNAANTLLWMGLILATFFIGVTYLAKEFNILPNARETVVSQIAHVVFGNSVLYYLVQISTLLVLFMAANTAFSGFPRLASILGRDRYLPRQLADVGTRLVFTNGIVLLAFLSGVLLIIFGGRVHSLIPIYAVGVFLSFTLSQAGMVKHWLKVAGEGWLHGAVINGLGAVVTAIALTVIAVTKFTHGAWVVTLLVPLSLYFFSRVHKHYDMVAKDLSLEGYRPPVMPSKHIVVIPVSGVHRGVLDALAYAQALSPNARAVHVATDPGGADEMRERWARYGGGTPLEVIYSPYRNVVKDLVQYMEKLQTEEQALVTVVIPEFVPLHFWQNLLHSQTASMLKLALLFRGRNIPVVSVPHQLRS